MKEPNRQRKNEIKYNITLDAQQKEVKAGIYEKDVTIILGDFGSGKAQPYYSKVLTPEGWVTMEDIKKGDTVCSYNGYAKVLDIFEQGEKDVYRIHFDDGSFTDCCKEHLWEVSTVRSRSRWKNTGSGNNRKRVFKFPVEYFVKSLESIIEDYKPKNNRTFKYAIKTKAAELPEKEYYIDPYLIGCLIGDGCLRYGSNFTSMDEEIVNEFKKHLEPLGFSIIEKKKHKPSKACDYSIRDDKNIRVSNGSKLNTLTEEIKRLGLYGKLSKDKFIPKEYLYGSIEQRLSLLQGLMDTDGSINGNSLVFSSSSLQLFKDVKYLIESLGGTVFIGKPKTFKNHYLDHHRMTFRLHDMNPFRIERKKSKFKTNQYLCQRFIINVEKVGFEKCKCILIDDPSHLYYTDNFILTHNTATAALSALDLLFKGHVDKIYITRPIDFGATGYLTGGIEEKLQYHIFPIKQNFYESYNKEKIDSLFKEGKIQIVPIDYMKGMTFCNSVTIVDEFEDINFADFKKILTRLGQGSKLIFTGSEEQIEIKDSCIHRIKCLKNCENVNYHILTGQHRNENIQKILDYIQENA